MDSEKDEKRRTLPGRRVVRRDLRRPTNDSVTTSHTTLNSKNKMSETDTTSNLIRPEIDVLGMFRRRWQHLTFGCVVGVVLAVLYWQTTTRLYESSIEVLVGQRSSEATNRGTITEGNGGDGFDGDQLATHMRLFVAKKVLAKAIENGNLKELESFKAVQQNGGSLLNHILKNVEVERGGEGSAEDAMVLRAHYRATDPAEAAIVLSAIFNSYKAYIDTQGQDSSKQAVELIEAARRTHEQELTDADLEYRNYVSSVPVLIEGDKVRDIHKERLSDMEGELNLVRSSLAESSSRLQVIESALSSGGVKDIDHLALLSQKEVSRLKFFLDMTRGGSQSESFQAQQPMRAEVAKTHYNRLLDLIQKEAHSATRLVLSIRWLSRLARRSRSHAASWPSIRPTPSHTPARTLTHRRCWRPM